MEQSKAESFSPFKLAFISSMGCWIADMVLYPFDTIATRIKANKKTFRSFKSEIQYIIKNESFYSFYRGFSSTFVCSFVPNIVYFLIYENLNKFGKQYFNNLSEEHSFLAKSKYLLPLITSPAAELVSLLVYLPFDIVRTRLQVNLRQYDYHGIWHGVNHIIEREGLIRLYKASHLYLLNTCIYVGLQMWLYEMVRTLLLVKYSRDQRKKLDLVESIATSVFVTTLATAFVNPLDILFTRYQIIDTKVEKLSTIKLLKDLIKHEGYIGFSKGLGAKIIGNVSLSIVWLPIYDYYKGMYGVDLFD